MSPIWVIELNVDFPRELVFPSQSKNVETCLNLAVSQELKLIAFDLFKHHEGACSSRERQQMLAFTVIVLSARVHGLAKKFSPWLS